MIVRVDIDRTLCTFDIEDGRKKATPNRKVIAKVNELYQDGAEIIIWTSRNNISRTDQTEFTRKQLKEWGVKYHKLEMDKPLFDLFVDDRAVNVKHWMDEVPMGEADE